VFPRVIWDAVPGATYYEVKFTWSSGSALTNWLPVLGTNGFPLPLGQPGHQYRAAVRACGGVPPSGTATETTCWSGTPSGALSTITVER
jgi:hypothetical protein